MTWWKQENILYVISRSHVEVHKIMDELFALLCSTSLLYQGIILHTTYYLLHTTFVLPTNNTTYCLAYYTPYYVSYICSLLAIYRLLWSHILLSSVSRCTHFPLQEKKRCTHFFLEILLSSWSMYLFSVGIYSFFLDSILLIWTYSILHTPFWRYFILHTLQSTNF